MSELVKALEGQGAFYADVDVSAGLALGKRSLPKIRFVVPDLAGQRTALRMAHDRVGRECGSSPAKDDPDILDNEKALCIAYEACRNPDNIKERIFGSPGWMDAHLTPDQIDWLVQTLNEVRYEKKPNKTTIGEDAIELVMRLCDEGAGTDVPTTVFSGYDRAFLTHALVVMSLRIKELELNLNEMTERAGEPCFHDANR